MNEIEINIVKLAELIAGHLANTPPWLSPAQAAAYVSLPEKTLAQYRRIGTGPRFSRVGRHVRYHRQDLDSWLYSLTSGGVNSD